MCIHICPGGQVVVMVGMHAQAEEHWGFQPWKVGLRSPGRIPSMDDPSNLGWRYHLGVIFQGPREKILLTSSIRISRWPRGG